MLHIVIVESPTPFQEAASFSCVLYVMHVSVTTPILFSNSYKKMYGVGTPSMYGQVYLLKCLHIIMIYIKTMGVVTPMIYGMRVLGTAKVKQTVHQTNKHHIPSEMFSNV